MLYILCLIGVGLIVGLVFIWKLGGYKEFDDMSGTAKISLQDVSILSLTPIMLFIFISLLVE
jgi:hypothetical protein